MSDKVYSWLLRLYPSHFRQAYGEEARQLFRDRARAEKGFLPAVRLWLDLLVDLAISVPREYRYGQPQVQAATRQPVEASPSFHVLEVEPPRFGALFLGGLFSLVALYGISVLFSHPGEYRRDGASFSQRQTQVDARPSPSGPAVSHAATTAYKRVAASGQPVDARLRADASNPSDSQSKAPLPVGQTGSPQEQVAQLMPQSANHSINRVAEEVKLDAAERQLVLNTVIKNLKEHYFDPEVARKATNELLGHQHDYDGVLEGGTFARLLTGLIREVSHDRHLEVVYSQSRLPAQPLTPTPEALARYQQRLQQENCTFEKVAILPHNVGYLKLNSFPEPSICRQTAMAAMAALNHAKAIIFDLRDNGGGFAPMVSFIAAYLFDHPEYLYDPRVSPTQRSWTRSPVPGNQLADKPVYVLTSTSTVSAAEQFCYDLKMLKRATFVGERTRGSAHAGIWYRIDDHFGMGIPETRPVNPFSKTDWEGTGVEPDVKVKAADALVTAEKLAERKMLRR